ncbi:MAG: hypothetical protein P1R58_12185 [bacterium]|nr:hypothetical protein [bacterium]
MKNVIFAIMGLALMPLLAFSTAPKLPPRAISIETEVLAFDKATNVADIKIIFTVPEGRWQKCTEFKPKLMKTSDLTILSDLDWVLNLKSSRTAEQVVRLQLNTDDTSFFRMRVECVGGQLHEYFRRYFVVGDSLEVWPSYPAGLWENVNKNRKHPLNWDTVSAEKLAIEYEAKILMNRPELLDQLEKALGYKPNYRVKHNYVIVTLPLGALIKLDKEIDLEFDLTDPPEWLLKAKPAQKKK